MRTPHTAAMEANRSKVEWPASASTARLPVNQATNRLDGDEADVDSYREEGRLQLFPLFAGVFFAGLLVREHGGRRGLRNLAKASFSL